MGNINFCHVAGTSADQEQSAAQQQQYVNREI
jgi:hypothetical protein